MDKRDPDIDITELTGDLEKESEIEESDSVEQYDDEPRPFNLQKKTFIVGGAAVLLIIIIVALLSSGGSEISKNDFSSLIQRMENIEARVSDLEGMEKRISSQVQVQKEAIKENLSEASGASSTMVQQLNLLAEKVETLQKRMGSVVEEAKAVRTAKAGRVQSQNVRYHVVERGESLYRIALKYGLTVDGLCHVNNITPGQSIFPGQKLIIKK
jgi:LysM repeat protein